MKKTKKQLSSYTGASHDRKRHLVSSSSGRKKEILQEEGSLPEPDWELVWN